MGEEPGTDHGSKLWEPILWAKNPAPLSAGELWAKSYGKSSARSESASGGNRSCGVTSSVSAIALAV
jgi:hypothetical protein